jgi:hypothetical protein
MAVLRRTAPWIILFAALGTALVTLIVMSQQGGVKLTRAVAVLFVICDVAISSSLVTLLITRDRSAPTWAERRLPFGGRWLWYLLVGLTVLSYMGLAPTFLFLYLQMKQ